MILIRCNATQTYIIPSCATTPQHGLVGRGHLKFALLYRNAREDVVVDRPRPELYRRDHGDDHEHDADDRADHHLRASEGVMPGAFTDRGRVTRPGDGGEEGP